jgi:hypothetical protein
MDLIQAKECYIMVSEPQVQTSSLYGPGRVRIGQIRCYRFRLVRIWEKMMKNYNEIPKFVNKIQV